MKKIAHTGMLLAFLSIVAFSSFAVGQTTVQVVTKTLSGEEQYTAGTKLTINGENAVIYGSSYSGKTIRYQIEIIARHVERNIAEQDLLKMKWIKGRQGKNVILRNYVELEAGESQPESSLKVIYHIQIPDACPLIINNYFGQIDLSNISSPVSINSQFAPIQLNTIHEAIEIKSKFGDISAGDLAGPVKIEAERADIDLKGISGHLVIEAVVSKIRFSEQIKLEGVQITAEKSEITMTADDTFRYFLALENVDFDPPDWMDFDPPGKDTKPHKSGFSRIPFNPLIEIHLTVGTLEIKKQ